MRPTLKKVFELFREKIQENIELFQPDFSQPFDFTTDASNRAIGAVLPQHSHPVTFISRTLNRTEENYATNEKELLAIVWVLKTLRNYHYGFASVAIITDRQPLTSAVAEKNSNLSFRRWKASMEESGAGIQYKPGRENFVADTLSRQSCNAIDDHISTYSESIHSTPSSLPIDQIQHVTNPVNFHRN